jgi:hypothetical protein
MEHLFSELKVLSSKCVPYVLVAALASSAGCVNGDSTGPTGPGGTSEIVAVAVLLSADPWKVVPEFRHDRHCSVHPPFGARLAINIRTVRHVKLHTMRFKFLDRFGRTAVPTLVPVDVPSSPPIPNPGSSAVTVPGTSPIPIPGSFSFSDHLIPGGTSHRFPFFLEFGCGVASAGTLSIDVDSEDENGKFDNSRVSVEIGG